LSVFFALKFKVCFNISNTYILHIIMLKKIIKTYYKLLDEKLENWTMVVLLIAILIISASLLTKDANAWLLAKNNIIESNITANNIIEINWVKYRIIIEKMIK
jgi:hypothetical protein